MNLVMLIELKNNDLDIYNLHTWCVVELVVVHVHAGEDRVGADRCGGNTGGAVPKWFAHLLLIIIVIMLMIVIIVIDHNWWAKEVPAQRD